MPTSSIASNRWPRGLMFLVGFAVALGLAGCGSGGKGPADAVSGKVTLNGAAVSGERVSPALPEDP